MVILLVFLLLIASVLYGRERARRKDVEVHFMDAMDAAGLSKYQKGAVIKWYLENLFYNNTDKRNTPYLDEEIKVDLVDFSCDIIDRGNTRKVTVNFAHGHKEYLSEITIKHIADYE